MIPVSQGVRLYCRSALMVILAYLDEGTQGPRSVAAWIIEAGSCAGGPPFWKNRHGSACREILLQPVPEGCDDADISARETEARVDRVDAENQARDRLDCDRPAIFHQQPGQERAARQAVADRLVFYQILRR